MKTTTTTLALMAGTLMGAGALTAQEHRPPEAADDALVQAGPEMSQMMGMCERMVGVRDSSHVSAPRSKGGAPGGRCRYVTPPCAQRMFVLT